jgi:hypothetical protein
VTPILILFGTFGFLILLKSPTGGARTFVGLGALLASSLILLTSVLTDIAVPGKLQCLLFSVPAYTMIAFAAIYGNATKAQWKYEGHIAEKLNDDLKELLAAEPARSLVIDGSVGYAPLVNQIANKRYRLLFHLVQIDMRANCHPVLRYFGIQVPAMTAEPQRTSIIAQARDQIRFGLARADQTDRSSSSGACSLGASGGKRSEKRSWQIYPLKVP